MYKAKSMRDGEERALLEEGECPGTEYAATSKDGERKGKHKLRRLFVGVEESGASRDLLVASWLFLLGSIVFTGCVGVQLAVDIKSLPFWMLTISGLLFCGGSVYFIRAFAVEAPTEVLYKKHSKAVIRPRQKNRCLQCADRHCGTNLLIASWLFLLACVPVVVASISYVVHHDDRLYFWGVLAGSIAFCVASGFFVVASYPEHLGKRNDHLPGIVANAGILDRKQARTHCGSEWLVSNWCFLILTAGWLFTSIFFILIEPSESDYQFSALEALIYFIASVYFVKGSYVAQAEAEEDAASTESFNEKTYSPSSAHHQSTASPAAASASYLSSDSSSPLTLQQPGLSQSRRHETASRTTSLGYTDSKHGDDDCIHDSSIIKV